MTGGRLVPGIQRRAEFWIRLGEAAALGAVLLAALHPEAAARREETNAQEESSFQAACQLFQDSPSDKTGAIDALDRFLKRFPDSSMAADAEFTMGQAYLERALHILRAEASAKKSSTARLLAPRNSAALEALQNARDTFKSVVDRRRKSGLSPSAQYRIGETAYNAKDWSGAIEEFKRVEKSYPKSYIVPESWMGIIYADIALEQFSQAEANLFVLGETYPSYLKVPEVLYAQGVINLHKGDYASAEKALRQVQTPDAQFYLGKTYLLSKRPFLAATTFERLVREYPNSDLKEESDFFIGDSFFLAKDFDGAITKYQRFLEKYPDSRLKVAALFRIGASYFQKKSFVDARANFQALLDRYPQDFFAPLAQYFVAESYLVSNQMREALFAYTKVITQFPETVRISPLAHYKLAWAQYQVGDYGQSAQTCRNFLELYPSHTLAKNTYLILGNALLSLKRYNEAVTSWQRIIDLSPTSEVAEQALFSILLTQYRLKNYDSILTSYQFIFRHLPPSQSKWRSLSYLYAAEAYLALNQVDEAQAIYDMILKVYPNDVAALYAQDGLAWCFSARGEDEAALQERRKLKDMLVVARSTFGFSGANELGIADSMFNQKNYEDAFQLYDKFAKENPQASEAPSALYRAGMSLYHLRYYTQAIEAWQKLLNDYPKAPEIQEASFQMADTLFRAQKYPQAVEAYRSIVEKYPRNPHIPMAQLRIAQSAFNAKDDAGTVRESILLIQRFPAAAEAADALDLMEAVFDRAPSMDFKEPFAAIVRSLPHKKIAGEAQFRLARRHFDKKDYASAAQEFQAFSVDFTEHAQLPKAQFFLAESLFQAGKYAAAVSAFQRALNNFSLDTDAPVALFHIASAHYNLKEYQAASTFYQRMLEEFPDSEYTKPALFNLALSFKALGKLDSAQDAYMRYMQSAGSKDPTAQAARWELFSIQKDRKDYESALSTLGQIQAEASDAKTQLEAAYRSGEVYVLMNRPDEAIRSWEKLRQMQPPADPFRLQGLIKLGELYEKVDPGNAISVYEDLARNSGNRQLSEAAREKAQALRGGAAGGAYSRQAPRLPNSPAQHVDSPAPKPKGTKKPASPGR
ncbi:MAG: tetratricopeptide repeat protein [Elusimicrobia bacterium]|nr:tetratricopeptide repeat protein [Elusimicrobiota bacterium]